jgi:hypothetical protein
MRKLVYVLGLVAVVGGIGLAAAGAKKEHQYDIRVGAISHKSFALVKFDATTGQSWAAVENENWTPIEESGELAPGSYDVHVEQFQTGDSTNWQMYRINKATGQTWVLLTRETNSTAAPDQNRWREIHDAT